MYASKRELLSILPELEIIQMDTGFRINKAKELKIILNIFNRQVQEHLTQEPGNLRITKQNKVSLYCAMKCFRRINKYN